MAPKKGQGSSAPVSDYSADLFLPGKWMKLEEIPDNEVDLVSVLTYAGWAPYAQLRDEWFLYAYGEFWYNAREMEDGIMGTIGDKEYLIS